MVIGAAVMVQLGLVDATLLATHYWSTCRAGFTVGLSASACLFVRLFVCLSARPCGSCAAPHAAAAPPSLVRLHIPGNASAPPAICKCTCVRVRESHAPPPIIVYRLCATDICRARHCWRKASWTRGARASRPADHAARPPQTRPSSRAGPGSSPSRARPPPPPPPPPPPAVPLMSPGVRERLCRGTVACW